MDFPSPGTEFIKFKSSLTSHSKDWKQKLRNLTSCSFLYYKLPATLSHFRQVALTLNTASRLLTAASKTEYSTCTYPFLLPFVSSIFFLCLCQDLSLLPPPHKRFLKQTDLKISHLTFPTHPSSKKTISI